MGAAIELSKLPEVLRKGKINPERAKRAFFKIARQVLIAETKKCFDEGRSPDGAVWLPLKHPRVRGSGTPRPLRDTGVLMASITANGPDHVERIEGQTLVFGTKAIQGPVHQYGGTIRPKNKYLTIPVSIEALRVQSPLRFPNADKRLIWAVGEEGGIVCEKLDSQNKNHKKKKGINSIYTTLRGKDVIIHFFAVTQVTIPARPFLGISQATAAKLARFAAEYIER